MIKRLFHPDDHSKIRHPALDGALVKHVAVAHHPSRPIDAQNLVAVRHQKNQPHAPRFKDIAEPVVAVISGAVGDGQRMSVQYLGEARRVPLGRDIHISRLIHGGHGQEGRVFDPSAAKTIDMVKELPDLAVIGLPNVGVYLIDRGDHILWGVHGASCLVRGARVAWNAPMTREEVSCRYALQWPARVPKSSKDFGPLSFEESGAAPPLWTRRFEGRITRPMMTCFAIIIRITCPAL